MEALTRIHHKLINAGGKRYTSGWLGMMDDAAWAGHFGKDYERWIALKKEYDPSSVLVSALFD